MKVKLNKGDGVPVNNGVFIAPTSGMYTIIAGSVIQASGYPEGVYDLRGMNEDELIQILEKMEQDFPALAAANKVRNSKLYRALK